MKSKNLFLTVTLACVFYGFVVEGSVTIHDYPDYGVQQFTYQEFRLPFDDHNLSTLLCENKDVRTEDGTNVLSDRNFKYVMGGKGERKVVCLNANATLYDLCNFADTVCWHTYLKHKISGKTEMTVEDAESATRESGNQATGASSFRRMWYPW